MCYFALLGAHFSVNEVSHSTHPHSTRKSAHTSPKNDANDTLAICEIALRPVIHFVAIKTVGQQDMKALRSARMLMVEQRTALANQARSLAAEQGVEIPVGIHILQQRLPDIIEDAEQLIFPVLCQLLFSLFENIHSLNERILSAERCLAALCQQQPKYKVLMTIPGTPLENADSKSMALAASGKGVHHITT